MAQVKVDYDRRLVPTGEYIDWDPTNYTGLLLDAVIEGLQKLQAKYVERNQMVRWNYVNYYEETYLELVVCRYETDAEYAKRIAREEAAHTKYKAKLVKDKAYRLRKASEKQEFERAEYERLKAIYGGAE
jgi:uncharacterized protein YaiL (DUF2058 family)